jgi:hypothetical protein
MTAQIIPDEILNALHNEHQDNDKVINPPCLIAINDIQKKNLRFEYFIYASKVYSEGKTYLGNIFITNIDDYKFTNIKNIRLEHKTEFIGSVNGRQLFVERSVRKIEGNDMPIFTGIFSNERPLLLDTLFELRIIVEFHVPQTGLKFKLDTVPLPQSGILSRGTYDNTFPRTIQNYSTNLYNFNIDAKMIFIMTEHMLTELNKITLEIDEHHSYIIDTKNIKFKLPDNKFVYIIQFNSNNEFYESKKTLNFNKLPYVRIRSDLESNLDIWTYGFDVWNKSI